MAKTKRDRLHSVGSTQRDDVAKAVFKMKTNIGQHVLKNPGVAQAIVDKAELKQSDTVLEVGPGTGNLTVRILQKARKVTTVELDPRMAAEVTKRVQGKPEEKRLQVLLGDVIKTDLPSFDVCISNTPYQISSPLTFKLLAMSPAPRVCILMFQREFALRLFARPGDSFYSRLSVNAQMWAHIDHVMNVGRNNFRPPPQVESAVVRLVPKVPRPQISYEEWDGLLRICFMRKNRTIRANFLGASSVLELLEENWRTWCAQHDIAIDEEALPDVVSDRSNGVATEMQGASMNLDAVDQVEADQSAESTSTHPGGRRKARRGKIATMVREKVRVAIEEDTKLAEKRARTCDQGDFLNLLWAFNKQGIHFA